jgi:hypothetical protein
VHDCQAPVIVDKIDKKITNVDSEKTKLQTVLFVCMYYKNDSSVVTNTTVTKTEKVVARVLKPILAAGSAALQCSGLKSSPPHFWFLTLKDYFISGV